MTRRCSGGQPLILAGGKDMGFRHGQYVNLVGDNAYGGSWSGGQEPWQREFTHEDRPLADLYLTMLQRLGVEADTFAGSTTPLEGV